MLETEVGPSFCQPHQLARELRHLANSSRLQASKRICQTTNLPTQMSLIHHSHTMRQPRRNHCYTSRGMAREQAGFRSCRCWLTLVSAQASVSTVHSAGPSATVVLTDSVTSVTYWLSFHVRGSHAVGPSLTPNSVKIAKGFRSSDSSTSSS